MGIPTIAAPQWAQSSDGRCGSRTVFETRLHRLEDVSLAPYKAAAG